MPSSAGRRPLSHLAATDAARRPFSSSEELTPASPPAPNASVAVAHYCRARDPWRILEPLRLSAESEVQGVSLVHTACPWRALYCYPLPTTARPVTPPRPCRLFLGCPLPLSTAVELEDSDAPSSRTVCPQRFHC
ncbi:hypothetical protein EVAR_53251_1 [Eumeta japonica]|uniref:Uncharacterized protein n=1 Tax=Eumeta variegata TaxID=151549 RepID=A0A4C1XBW2_EUMVA|nr:hypothetical protein EVAR_53251_1 [Eumeta japonica]